MEYCPGGELFDRICSGQAPGLREADACKMFSKLVRAVNHCHANHVTHRDIKPENIMFGEDGEIKLIDFGLSRLFKEGHMKSIVGTVYYIAPEVL